MRDLDRDRRLCRNFLCLLNCLERRALVEAGVLRADDETGWRRFLDDPYRAYLRLDDGREDKCFALILSQMPANLRAAVEAVKA